MLSLKTHLVFSALLALNLPVWGQTVSTVPPFPRADESVTIRVDVSGTSLDGYSGDVWIWTWIERGSSDINAPTNVDPATSAQSDALMTRVSSNPDVYEITFVPVDFFSSTVEELDQIGLKLKSQAWDDGIQSDKDLFVTFSQGDLQLNLTEPSFTPLFVDPGESFTIAAVSSRESTISIEIDGVEVTSTPNTTTLSYIETAMASGSKTVKIIATTGTETVETGFEYLVRGSTVMEPRATGILDGINYDPSDHTTAILSLWAPLKSSVHVVGDFNDWQISGDYLLKQDGEHFWIEITGLVPGQEYGFRYLVDETIWVADPYAEKILDPDDKYIPAETYPGLMPYPEKASSPEWYFNRVSVLQTAQTQYVWQHNQYLKPPKEELLVYELLIRDFLGEDKGNYQAMIDTLSYIKDMGFNGIELMPVMEFSGNLSWGYNPTFLFAPDKYYGTRNELKRFIDEAHSMDMVVILDMVLNQNDIPAPYAAMYFNYNKFKPTPNNPWFNTDARHPFNVFYDFNHESTYTQTFVDTVSYYWLNEYKFDGFRFDLSKGFTQTFNTDVDKWGMYDAGRISLLKRMADKIWAHTPEAYVILEHFAENREEKELSNHGMMLWGNAHFDYKEAILGYGDNQSIGWAYYKDRGWDHNFLISYIESHDEQRQMFEAVNYGNSSGSYSIKSTDTALDRLKLAASFFFTVPGPKMIWQFGEFGYDVDINENGRTGVKPTKWEYLDDPERLKLKQVYQELIKLRSLDVFKNGEFTWQAGGNLKSIHINHSSMDITIIGNFGVTQDAIDPSFHSTGTWYDYFTSIPIEVLDRNQEFILSPGQFHIFSSQPLPPTIENLVPFRPDKVTGVNEASPTPSFHYYPNPTTNNLTINFAESKGEKFVRLLDSKGSMVSQVWASVGAREVDMIVAGLAEGYYLLHVADRLGSHYKKVVISR